MFYVDASKKCLIKLYAMDLLVTNGFFMCNEHVEGGWMYALWCMTPDKHLGLPKQQKQANCLFRNVTWWTERSAILARSVESPAALSRFHVARKVPVVSFPLSSLSMTLQTSSSQPYQRCPCKNAPQHCRTQCHKAYHIPTCSMSCKLCGWHSYADPQVVRWLCDFETF